MRYFIQSNDMFSSVETIRNAMPELSCVIEYDPTVESEEDILRMAESVPANTAATANP